MGMTALLCKICGTREDFRKEEAGIWWLRAAFFKIIVVRESFPRQVDKKSRGPQRERGLEFSRRKRGQTFFPPLHSLGLYIYILYTA